jgi:hypothetical protein
MIFEVAFEFEVVDVIVGKPTDLVPSDIDFDVHPIVF